MNLSIRTAIYVALGLTVALGAAYFMFVHRQPVQRFQAENNPSLLQFQADGQTFMLTEALHYRVVKTGRQIIVPAGFVTDFASVPWFLQSVISVLGRHSVPAIVHDYLYWEQACTRLQADDHLYEAMIEYGSSWFQKNAVYYGVRAGGTTAWSQNTEDRKRGLPRVVPLGADSKPLLPNASWAGFREQLFNNGVRATPVTPGNVSYCAIS